jgi:hypothetical protein
MGTQGVQKIMGYSKSSRDGCHIFRGRKRGAGMNGRSPRLDDDGDLIVVTVAEPVEWHNSDFDVDLCSLVHEIRTA